MPVPALETLTPAMIIPITTFMPTARRLVRQVPVALPGALRRGVPVPHPNMLPPQGAQPANPSGMRKLWNTINTPSYGKQFWKQPIPGLNNRGLSFIDVDLPGVFQHGLGGIHFNPRWNVGPLSLDLRGGDIDARLFGGPSLIWDFTPEAAAGATEAATTAAGESSGFLGTLGEWATGLFTGG